MGPRAETPTAEDLFATARCLCAFSARRPGLDVVGVARRLAARARAARTFRERHGQAHPRFGDGSLSAASGLALLALRSRGSERTRPLGLFAALAVAIAAVDRRETRAAF